jgi:hypothetical protein
MEIISGFEGKDINEAIETIKSIWEKHGTKEKGGLKARYQLLLGRLNDRAVLMPTVSTRAGTEIVLVWNLKQDAIKKLEEEAKIMGLPVSYRPYLWFNEIPNTLPSEKEEKEEKILPLGSS